VIEIEDLTKYYGDRRALGPVTATIEDGEVVGLLGLNGAGKTTTLRVLACDLLPSGGTVRIDGIDVVERPQEVRARVGYLPDTPPLYTEMTVREYLSFAAELRDVPRAKVRGRVDEAVRVTGLDRVESELISTLSHGFKQRVGIAQAIVHEPKLLVLDEPITGLDPRQIVEMRSLIRSLAGKHTILLSSHNLPEISETCDRILVITDGVIGASGTEEELTSKLATTAVLELRVRGDRARVLEIARDVDGVRRADAEAHGDEVELEVEASGDVREDLAKALVGAGLGLLELRRTKQQLENVFLALAGGDGPVRAPATEPAKAAPDETATEEPAAKDEEAGAAEEEDE